MAKNTLTLAGHKFTLKNIKYGIHSEETVDFMADLYCDGKFLCYCENEGHGGSTFTHCTPETRDKYYDIYAEVGNVVWLRCNNGTILYHNLGTVADELLELISLNKEVSRLQKDALVLRRPENYEHYDPYLYTRKINASVKTYVQDYPGTLAKMIADAQDEGWEVLNNNIPERIYEGAKEWRDPKASISSCFSKKK